MESKLLPSSRHNLSILLDTSRRIGTITYWVDNVFPPDDLGFGLDTNTNCAVIYDLIAFRSLNDGVVIYI